MPWFKVDDSLAFHAKFVALPLPAAGLWMRAGAWCAQQLTDGIVPASIVRAMGATEEESDALVAARLWRRTRDGFVFHDWTDYQPSRAEVHATRDWDRRRMELHRDKELVAAIRGRDGDRCRYCGRQVRWNARRGPDAATYDHVVPRGENSLSNVVVACGPCNSSKGARTPDEAGMPLLPPGSLGPIEVVPDPDPVGSKNRSGSDQDPVPTRPDPSRSSSVESSSGGASSGTREAGEPSARCPRHLDVPAAGPCGPCGDARKAHEAWVRTQEQTRRDAGPVVGGHRCPSHPAHGAGNCPECAATATPMPANVRELLRRGAS